MKVLIHGFECMASMKNLLCAWQEFLVDKRRKKDVQEFQACLLSNILALHHDLMQGLYRHGGYHAFKINDPKPRDIHKATVRDRLLHHAVYRVLCSFFDRMFIADSFSCRLNKGTHRALNRFRDVARKVSKNNNHTCWILKCDIRKFFASIDHDILMVLLGRRIKDKRLMAVLEEVIKSFPAGLPLGNLTSQLFANVYLNELDQFIKHGLKVRHYIRYADDFVMLSNDRQELEALLPCVQSFLRETLRLELHKDKVFFKTLNSGLDFLGWVHFFDHRVLRTTTKNRIFKKLHANLKPAAVNSYLGLLNHGNANKLRDKIISLVADAR